MKLYFDSVEEYVSYYRELIEREREAQRKFHEEEILRLSPKERERRGRALLSLRAFYIGEIFSGLYGYKFSKIGMGEHEINVGDVVLVSRGKNPIKTGIEGVVYEKGSNYLTVLLPYRISLGKKSWRIDLFVNDVTFKRMEEALNSLANTSFPVDVLLGKRNPQVEGEEKDIVFINQSLNEFQKFAVRKALSSKDIFMVHGPFGTGKTTTLVEIVLQYMRQGKKVIVTADSNTAVDVLVEAILKMGVKPLRVGHPARIRKDLIETTLEYQLKTHPLWKDVEALKKKLELIRKEREDFLAPIPSRRRGLKDSEIIELAELGLKKRGHKLSTIKSMAMWIKLTREMRELYEKVAEIEGKVIRDIVDRAQIVCATNSGAGSEFLKDVIFDVAVIDEATQATEPSCLIPLVKARRVILAGDHKQLPPTVISEDERLKFTLFERFLNLYPEFVVMLRVQYRMNEKIKEFPSKRFYQSLLISDESVKDIKLSEITNKPGNDPTVDDTPLVFIDTGGFYREARKKGSFSKYNIGEAILVKEIVNRLVSLGVNKRDIGVITPYKDQEGYIKSLLPDVEVKTVDGFQGREKEVIILSLVRSNQEEEIGFLKDERRLNVAITRAKRKLILIGDAKTLSSSALYKDLIDYIGTNGIIVGPEAITSGPWKD